MGGLALDERAEHEPPDNGRAGLGAVTRLARRAQRQEHAADAAGQPREKLSSIRAHRHVLLRSCWKTQARGSR